MKSVRATILLSLALMGIGGGCTERVIAPDIAPECAHPLACQVTGVDLVVEPVQLLLPANLRWDSVRGMPVLMPGEQVLFVVTVWNRGDTTSPADTLNTWPTSSAWTALPGLAPGATFTDTLTLQAPGVTYFDYRTDMVRIDAFLTNWLRDDPVHGNDANISQTVVVAVPVLRATLVTPDTLRESVPFNATVTIANTSRFADMPARAMAFCLFDFDVGCGSWAGAPFHLVSMPSIRAGQTWSTSTMTVTMPPIDDRHYAELRWNMYACLAEPNATLAQILDWRNRVCIPDGRVVHTRAS